MSVQRVFRGKKVRRTKRLGSDKILVIFENQKKGQPHKKAVFALDQFLAQCHKELSSSAPTTRAM